MSHPLIVDGELVLYGFVGDTVFVEGFTARQVVNALAALAGNITVRLNSPGGIAEDGVAIYHALKGYKRGKVTTHVDAIAASAASVIAMAGDRIVIPEASLLMIHNASGLTMGTAEDHRKTGQVLDKIDGQMVTIYAGRTGMTASEVKALMTAETWLTGSEALEMLFADEAPTEAPAEPFAFDYGIYAHAPETLKRFTAKRRARTARPSSEHVLASTPEDAWAAEWDHNEAVRGEFVERSDWLAFKRAEASGKFKVMRRGL